MAGDVERIARWLRRARPPRSQLVRAMIAGTVAAITNIGLLIGAVGLLVESAHRPGLRAVAGVLIVIELLAFLRSPLRFLERLSAHRLGFTAVTRWRRWLIATIGRWDYSRWREHAAGDLLERSLRDTDELQDLWLRFALPIFTTSVSLLAGDVVLALLPPHGHWLLFALLMLVVQALAYLALFSNLRSLIELDRGLRAERGAFLAALVELSGATPELSLLGHEDFAFKRLSEARQRLGHAEALLQHARRWSNVVPLLSAVAALGALALTHPRTSPLWIVIGALLAVANADSLSIVRSAIETAVAVSAAADRLEALDTAEFSASHPWPVDATFRFEQVFLREDDTPLVEDASFAIVPGRRVALIGTSGSGKSTLLRAMCGLDGVASGRVSIGGVELHEIDETVLRAELAYVASEPGLTRGYATDVIHLGRSSSRDARLDLSNLGLATDEKTRWDELSRGERQRVAIVRALVTSPAIVVLDEPTSGLGASETDRVLSLLASIDATVVIATHDPRVIAWCDDVLELVNHRLRSLNR
ncbi:MAG: ATP-binding cassette domain-containing protein [Acidimicrobiales bacterium]